MPEADIAMPGPLPNVIAHLQKKTPLHILAIGSSSTYGTGASSQFATYPSRLRPILASVLKGVDVEIVNRGVAGEMAETTADRIMSEVALSKPDLVLWQLGTNDALSRIPPDDFEATVRETVRWLKAQNIDVVLVGMQYVPRFSRDPAYSAIRQVLRKIAAEEHVLYVRRYEAMLALEQARANEQLMSADQFHLNDLGYRCMAEHVARAVALSLFAKLPPRPAAND
ncbi:MAG: SGNH/GDSL hydrolase family protein [Methylovirgula sp.]